jgi:hypothetical protein
MVTVYMFRRFFSDRQRLKNLSETDRALFDQGWLRPDCLDLYGRAIQPGMYVVYCKGAVRVATYIGGFWVFEQCGQPISEPLYIYAGDRLPFSKPFF